MLKGKEGKGKICRFASFQRSKMSSPWHYGEASFLKYLNIKINDCEFSVSFKVACGIIFS